MLNGVTIVDTADGKLTPDMAVVIEGDKIKAIARAGSVTASGTARAIDARGKFVVPGYLEMHNHPLMSPDPRSALALMLAHGITGLRQMAGTPPLLESRRQGKLMPATGAPELLAMPGLILTGPGTPEVAVAEIQKQKAMGADFIKMVDAPPATFFAALKEAKAQGLPMVGHLPPVVPVLEAAQAGMRAIEHLGPRDGILLSCSTDEAALRQTIGVAPPRPPLAGGPALAAMIQRTLANPIMATNPEEFVRYQRVIDTFSEAKCRDLAAKLAATGMWQVPTLTRVRAMEFGNDPQYRNDPNLRYVPAPVRQLWLELADQFPEKVSPAAQATLKQFFALQLRLVKILKDAGVPMLAGTDGGQWLVPGISLHQEFVLLAEAGLSPLDILQMTTINGAKFLGREASMGSVAVGKNADLVLVDANPLDNVRNFSRIHAVVRAGAYHDAGALEEMKKLAEASAAMVPPPPPPKAKE